MASKGLPQLIKEKQRRGLKIIFQGTQFRCDETELAEKLDKGEITVKDTYLVVNEGSHQYILGFIPPGSGEGRRALVISDGHLVKIYAREYRRFFFSHIRSVSQMVIRRMPLFQFDRSSTEAALASQFRAAMKELVRQAVMNIDFQALFDARNRDQEGDRPPMMPGHLQARILSAAFPEVQSGCRSASSHEIEDFLWKVIDRKTPGIGPVAAADVNDEPVDVPWLTTHFIDGEVDPKAPPKLKKPPLTLEGGNSMGKKPKKDQTTKKIKKA